MRYKIDSSSVARLLQKNHSRRGASFAYASGAGRSKLSFAYASGSCRSGFSLTELIVVMVIMGMLAGVVAFAMGGVTDNARKTKAVTDISTYVNAIDAFYAVQGRYPTNDEGLAILTAKSKFSPTGYIKKVKKDPWNNPYVYRIPGKTSPFEIVSYGADRKEGGTEVNADISSDNLEND